MEIDVQPIAQVHPGGLGTHPGVGLRRDPGERQRQRQARHELRAQIAKLERELSDAFVSAFPRAGVDVSVGGPAAGPRVLNLGELERLRDRLATRLSQARRQLARHGEAQERNRILLERMLLEPGRYKFVRIASADLGEGGCGEWQVRPRFGLLGMLAGWWQVKLSSGCPLGRGRCSAPPLLRPGPVPV